MIKVYLLQTIYAEYAHEEIILNIDGSDIWIGEEGLGGRLDVIDFTPIFWESVARGENNLLTYVGEL